MALQRVCGAIAEHLNSELPVSETSTQAGDSSPEFDELPPYLVPHSQSPTRIVYEDNDLLIVDKPHHLLSVPADIRSITTVLFDVFSRDTPR